MEADFWLKKWESNEIGFHQETVNEMLKACWPEVGAPAGGSVLVPLCGKSLDMCWLAGQGHRVVGLINTLEYPPEMMDGPPFSISETRLQELLVPPCGVRRLRGRDVNLEGTILEGRGRGGLAETAYQVRLSA